MQFVTVARYANASQADLAALGLRAAGFDVLVHSELSGPLSGVSWVRLQVPEDRADEAREFLAAEEKDGEGEAP